MKKINDLFRAPLDFLSRAEQTIKSTMITYDREQERIAAEERRKAEEAAARSAPAFAQKRKLPMLADWPKRTD